MAAHPKRANVYGVALTAIATSQTAPAAVTIDATVTAGAPASLSDPTTNRGSWHYATPVTIGNSNGGHLQAPQSIAFPIQEPNGGTPGMTYLLGFSSSHYSDNTLVPDSVGRLFRTTDGGQTWTSLVGTTAGRQLPNVPVWVVKYDPVTPGVIYVGTTIGVYVSKDDGATWDRLGNGLPMVSVRDIFIASNSDFIRIATYGRGLWELYPNATESQGVNGNGDFDRNLQLDWIDLGAMGARLGSNPATASTPLYSTVDDMTPGASSPPTAGVDESDLTALLAGIGDRP
jgi:hypothetical protein